MPTPPTPHPLREASTLALLRDVIPPRRVTLRESLAIAELQANRMREYFGLVEPAIPSDLVTELPRIAVRYDIDLPVSGSAHWDGRRWIITLNAAEPFLRRRFSLMHEFKHIIDHTNKHLLYGAADDPAAAERAERVADYFAACLLMPKRWVKRLWGEGVQRPSQLARRFGVSVPAMRYRINHLALTSTADRRCEQIAATRPHLYTRQPQPPPRLEVVA